MISHFLKLEWKQFFRSSYWQKSIVLNLLLAFFGLFLIVMFLAMGIALYPALKEEFPDTDPFITVNNILFYWFLADLVIRFFFQKLPVMSVKPLLTLPIKKSKIVHYVLGKSTLSFFNFLLMFAVIPFGIMLVMNDYNVVMVLFWVFVLINITLIINFLNFLIENLASKTELSYLPIITFTGILYVLNYFNIISFSTLLSAGIMGVANSPVLILVPIIILTGLYFYNYKILRKKLYIDNSLKSKTHEAKTTDLAWTSKFGEVAPFMQLDIKLLLRNKRPRSSIFILIIGLFYGLFFYPNPLYQDRVWMFVFVGIFVTGIFLINFGQFIPAWDSGYYKMLMSQNIKYEQYLKSKFTLMSASVVIMFLLSFPYVYFGWNILLAHFAAAVYNIGVNTHVIMFAGAYNRKKINLDQRAAFNYQGTGAVQWLVGFPLLLVPILIFLPFYYFFGFESGLFALILLGLIGIVLHQKIMKLITNKYLEYKYQMIEAFGQEN
jgi:hypothetical protein